MENWITYIMECAICLALLYLPFGTLLRKETFFQYNRYALLAISVLSFILPLISIPEITAPLVENENISIQLTEINVLVSGKVLPASIHWKAILAIIYLSGAVACLLYKIYDLIRLTRFIPQGCLWTHQENGIHIHCHAHDIVPFSWMSHIVISEKDYRKTERPSCSTNRPTSLAAIPGMCFGSRSSKSSNGSIRSYGCSPRKCRTSTNTKRT